MRIAPLLPAVLLRACGDPAPAPPPPPELEVGQTARVVPSAGLPAEVELQPANNNLDVTRHDGRVFLAFRTGPSHFASSEVRLWVVSSDDEATWSLERGFHRETDLREPRLLSLGGRLLLYFAVLGASATDFEPQGVMVTERLGPGAWSEPEWVLEPGFIAWRVRVVAGEAQLVGYVGGESIYDFSEGSIAVHWLRSQDGRAWEPVVPGRPVVLEGGCSETDVAWVADGGLVAVCRNELGDDQGWGSKVCRAAADAPGDWRCEPDRRKYDSPLLLRVGARVYLFGRRNVTETGDYDLQRRDRSEQQQTLEYLLDYWGRPKRCALWEVDPDAPAVTFLADLPSRGDTCFPSALELPGGRFALYNYSSPVDGPDLSWQEGQHGETWIYRTELTLPAGP